MPLVNEHNNIPELVFYAMTGEVDLIIKQLELDSKYTQSIGKMLLSWLYQHNHKEAYKKLSTYLLSN